MCIFFNVRRAPKDDDTCPRAPSNGLVVAPLLEVQPHRYQRPQALQWVVPGETRVGKYAHGQQCDNGEILAGFFIFLPASGV